MRELKERIWYLEELRDGLGYVAKDLNTLTEEIGLDSEKYHLILIKTHRTIMKRKLTRQINKLKKNMGALKACGK